MTKVEIWLYFLRLGATGFGGPIALIAQIQKDLVDDKKVIDQEQFRTVLGLIKSLPGPVAVQVATFCAYLLSGPWSAILAATLFVLPAATMIIILGYFFEQIPMNDHILNFMSGLQGAAFILICGALLPLAKPAIKKIEFWLLSLASFIFIFYFQIHEALVILFMGSLSILLVKMKSSKALFFSLAIEIFWIALKAGGLSFGTGLAIIPLLQSDFVSRYNWVTNTQFLDAIALGQLTPGPVSVSVTLLGFEVAGLKGALAGTLGIFLPGIFNMTTWFPHVYRLLARQTWIKDFVLGATAAICAGIIAALIGIGKNIVPGSLVIPFLLFLLSFKKTVPSWLMILISGAGWYLLFLVEV